MRRAVRRAVMATGMLGVALAALAGPAAAGDQLETKWRNACWRDAFTMCTLHAIGNDRAGVRDCLVRNIDRISKPCRAVIEEANDKGIHDARSREEPVASTSGPATDPAPR
jgi:hypothetical protein